MDLQIIDNRKGKAGLDTSSNWYVQNEEGITFGFPSKKQADFCKNNPEHWDWNG